MGAPLSFTGWAVPLRVTAVTGRVLPRSRLPLTRSVYDRTRGKSSPTATVSWDEPMVAEPLGFAAPAGTGDGSAAAAGRAVPTSARTAAEATATRPAEGNLGDMAPE